MDEKQETITEILRLCAEIDAAFRHSHTEGEAVRRLAGNHLRHIGQALIDEGGIELLRAVERRVVGKPNAHYLQAVWDELAKEIVA